MKRLPLFFNNKKKAKILSREHLLNYVTHQIVELKNECVFQFHFAYCDPKLKLHAETKFQNDSEAHIENKDPQVFLDFPDNTKQIASKSILPFFEFISIIRFDSMCESALKNFCHLNNKKKNYFFVLVNNTFRDSIRFIFELVKQDSKSSEQARS